MENLKTNWKLPKKQKIPAANRKLAAGNWKHSENSRIYSVFSQKNCPLPCQIPESGRKSGHQGGQTAPKWLDNTVKPCPKIGWRNRYFSTIQQRNKPVTSFLSQSVVWVWQKRYLVLRGKKSTIVEKFNCFLSLWAIAASIPDTLPLWFSSFSVFSFGCTTLSKNSLLPQNYQRAESHQLEHFHHSHVPSHIDGYWSTIWNELWLQRSFQLYMRLFLRS